jgi:hypothetical protein
MKVPLRSSIVAVFAVTAILCVGVATAQVSKGSISGTVVDPSGAAVVRAQSKRHLHSHHRRLLPRAIRRDLFASISCPWVFTGLK